MERPGTGGQTVNGSNVGGGRMSRFRFIAVAAALVGVFALALAACGGDDDSGGSNTSGGSSSSGGGGGRAHA